MEARFCDESELGFGWIVDEFLGRASHALVVDGEVWLIDPVDWEPAFDRVQELGRPRGVIQLLDRHERDGPALAARLGVERYVVPTAIGGAPFVFLPIVLNRFWREVALWWPGPRLLACADVLGTVGYFLAGDEAAGIHPVLRPFPPKALRRLDPEQVLVGHGAGLHGPEAAFALAEALRTSRRRIPAVLAGALRRGGRRLVGR